MAKEGLFNVLANSWELEGIKVLDLFAGIGGISLEFASRGAESVLSVEIEPRHANFIDSTAKSLGLEGVTVWRADAFSIIGSCKEKFNIVFADPPYELEKIEKLPDMVFQNNLLHEGGELIIEHSERVSFSGHQRLSKVKSYGAVNFSFFE
jgi:16S rRNA (guanine966-N2)-methyltransferase